MQKLTSLRTALSTALPELKRNPENLRIWIERGNAQMTNTKSEAFSFSFQANVLIVEMTTDIAALGLALFRWLRINQIELLAPKATGFAFDADLLDNGCADVLIQMDLTQTVAAATDEDGMTQLTYVPEQTPLFLDDLRPDGSPDVPLLVDAEIYAILNSPGI